MFSIVIDATIIKSLSNVMSTKDVRYYLCGINVGMTSTGKVFMQATNGSIGGRVVLSDGAIVFDGASPLEFDTIIPSQMVKDLSKVKGNVALNFTKPTEGGVWFVQTTANGYNYSMQCINGKFPDMGRVLPYTPIEGIVSAPMLVQPVLLLAFAKFADGILGRKNAGEHNLPLQQVPTGEDYNTNAAFWYAGLVGSDKTKKIQMDALKLIGLESASGVVMPMRLV